MAQYPPATGRKKSQEIPLHRLTEIFKNHANRFDEEYKKKLFQLGKGELSEEAKLKYNQTMGQAKVNFLALSKKSQKKLQNAYFKDQASSEKMDNLISRLQRNKILCNT